MGPFSGALAIFLLSFAAGVFTAPTSPTVDLGYAQYEGSINAATGNSIFLGMRYATPPTGKLRWRAPQQPATVAGVQQANAQPPMCMQAGSGDAPTSPFRQSIGTRASGVAASEDCLFLNVYSPNISASRKLPVVVWIHGGGYEAGDASSFNGEDLIQEASGGVVAVIIQYRLGVFGFLAGNEVKFNGVLNAGLLDQEFALQWVQSHITKFGGDPTQVTIWGESAGAGSVLQHVVAHGGKTNPPLFRGAITSSTFLPSQYQFNDTIPEALYAEVVSQTNCTTTTTADTLTCLRNVDVGTLETVNVNICLSGFFGTFVFVPVVDGEFITQRPTISMEQGKVNGKALLSVTNTFEGFIFVDQSTAATVQTSNYVSQLFPKLGAPEISQATALYQNLGTPLDQADAVMGESIFICPTYFLLRSFNENSFKGEFAIPPAHHGDDVQYYFPTPGVPPAFNNTAFDKAFSESFLNFVISLDPNVKTDPSDITPTWRHWGGSVEMIFNRTSAGAPVVQPISTSNARLERCNFWESVGALTGQ